MAKRMKELPLVSVVIPTYNEEKFIGSCLESLYAQDYPQDKMEIIIVDNGSEDKTLKIIDDFSKKKKKVILLHNKIKNPEASKLIGLKKSRGELIYFGDSDVILKDKHWLSSMTAPFVNEENVFASECDWGYLKDFSVTAKYCALLQIADPLARMITKRFPKEIKKKEGYEVFSFDKMQNPVLYCPLWKKKIVENAIKDYGVFNEGRTPSILIRQGKNKIAHVECVKAYHYYVDSFSEFLQKRGKIARKHLARERAGEETWVEKGGNVKLYLSAIYCFSIILPLAEAIKNSIRDRTAIWLIHPVTCFVTAWIYGKSFLKAKFGGKR